MPINTGGTASSAGTKKSGGFGGPTTGASSVGGNFGGVTSNSGKGPTGSTASGGYSGGSKSSGGGGNYGGGGKMGSSSSQSGGMGGNKGSQGGGNFGRGDTPSSGQPSFGRISAPGPNAYQRSFANSPERMMAVSRGPGLLTSLAAGNVPRAQERALTSIGLALGQKMGLPESSNLGIDRAHLMAKTAAGEVGRYGQLDYDAATNTMLNRMAINPALDFNRMMENYDANAMSSRTRTKSGNVKKGVRGAYEGFMAAEPGTPTYQKGLYSIANAMSPESTFSTTAPSKVLNATHYYSGPRTQSYQKNFAQYGPHKFGSPDYSQTQIASARSLGGVPTTTQFASGYGLPRAKPAVPNIEPAGYTTMTPTPPAAFSGPSVLTGGIPRAKPASPALRATMAQAFSTARPMTLSLGGPLGTLGSRRGRVRMF